MLRSENGNFFFAMSLVVAAVVAAAFGKIIGPPLVHPPSPRPWILDANEALFTGWVVLFIAQTGLIRLREHRRWQIEKTPSARQTSRASWRSRVSTCSHSRSPSGWLCIPEAP